MTRIDLHSQYLEGTLDDGVLRVVINRPERRNACTIEMYHGIKRAAALADADPHIDTVLLTGVGDLFCVGGEMGGKHEGRAGIDHETDGFDMLPFRQLEATRALVVSAVNGLCHGGGLNMVLCSDVAIASDRASFRAPELLRGVADPYLAARLPARVGMTLTKYLMFTAASISAGEAERIGLVAKTVAHEQLPAQVAWVLEQIRSTGPAARAAIKQNLNRQLPPFDMPMFVGSVRSPEAIEGFRSFVEKRPPVWPRGGA
jgi:enoyl-CoA hydratase/carnithine racemase